MVALCYCLARDPCAIARPGGWAQIDLPAMLAPDIPRRMDILLGRAGLACARVEYDQRPNRRVGKVQHAAEYNIRRRSGVGKWELGVGEGYVSQPPTPIS